MSALAFKALRRLADGRFHSGEDMARAFGRSRASLSDALKQAPTLGIEVFSVRGKGYRLAEPIEFLDAAAIGARLRADDPRLSLEVVDEIDSTSTRLLELAAAGAGARGSRASGAASPFRSCGASSAARATWGACRSRAARRSPARSPNAASSTCR